MAHDGETYFEYNDLEQSILDQKQFENLRYYILYYNQKYDKISIKRPVTEGKIRYLADIPETNRYCCRDFYDKTTLVSFLQLVQSMDVEEGVTYHNFVITWGHGGGLFYFPLGKFEDLLREFGLTLNQNEKTISTIKSEIRKNLCSYMQASGSFSNKEKNSFNKQQFAFFNKDLFTQAKGFTNIIEENALNFKLSALDECIAHASKLYTATDLNEIFKEGLGYVDVYFALNCYTQMIDTGYELRHSVNMMVASQTTMPLPGINYRMVFAMLEENPNMKLPELANAFVNSFDIKYSDKFLHEFLTHYPDFDLTIVSFACNFLTDYDLLVKCLNDLTLFLKNIYNDPALIGYKTNVIKARKLCGDLTPDDDYGIIDLYNFVVQLNTQFQVCVPGALTKEISAIKEKLECVKKNVLAAMRKPEPDTEDSASGLEENHPSFLSFFAPAFFQGKHGIWRRLLDVYPHIKNEFTDKSDWDGFVTEFFDKTK